MKKKILITVLLVALFIVLIPQDAHAIPMGDYVYNINPDGTTCTIIQYTGGGGDVTIPNQLDGFDVTAIQGGAFYLKGITSVSLPNKLDKIYDYAFAENNITSLTIPDSVTEITSYAFEQNNISTLTLGNSLVLIHQSAFSQNSLSSVTLPDSLRYVYENAFADNSIASIALPAPPDGYIRDWNVISGGSPVTAITNHADTYIRDFVATPIDYTITYNLDGGTNHASNPATYTIEDAVTFSSPSKTGYAFGDWYSDSACTSGNEVTNIALGSTGDIALTAKWIAPHNVTINPNSNATISLTGLNQATHGENLIITIIPKAGYEFDDVDITGNYSYTLVNNGDGSFTLTLEYVHDDNEIDFIFTTVQHTVNITCGANGSVTPSATQTVDHGNNLTITPTPNAGYSPVVTAGTHTIIDNNDGTYILKNVTSDVTISVTFEPTPVTSLTLADDALEMNVGIISNLASTFPYTILPADAANKAVRYVSTNPEVAEINNSTGMITTKKQGITQIYVISEQNNTIYDSLTLTVKDPTPTPVPPETHSANIKGRLIDDSGNPLAGYRVTLCSDPHTTVTDANGYFQFISIPFTNHTLIVNRPNITEAGRFRLNLLEGASTSSSIIGDNIDITFTDDTEDINFTLQESASPTGFDTSVAFTKKAKPVYDPSVKVENPNTGEWD